MAAPGIAQRRTQSRKSKNWPGRASRETNEPIERARVHIIHERPLYEDYLDDRAAAAKGTSFEGSMTRGKGRRK
jgi:hypothetical protein